MRGFINNACATEADAARSEEALPKYELVRENTMERDGYTLYQIRACKTFSLERGGNIKKGTLGGYVASEKNLSQEGSCWIFDTCAAYENARIKDDSSGQFLCSGLCKYVRKC